jgi:hypothetical protein
MQQNPCRSVRQEIPHVLWTRRLSIVITTSHYWILSCGKFSAHPPTLLSQIAFWYYPTCPPRNNLLARIWWSWGSSVIIVSDYRLDDRGSIPGRGKGFSCSLCVQTGSGAHPAPYPMGTGGPFPWGKARPGRYVDHSPPSSTEVENE